MRLGNDKGDNKMEYIKIVKRWEKIADIYAKTALFPIVFAKVRNGETISATLSQKHHGWLIVKPLKGSSQFRKLTKEGQKRMSDFETRHMPTNVTDRTILRWCKHYLRKTPLQLNHIVSQVLFLEHGKSLKQTAKATGHTETKNLLNYLIEVLEFEQIKTWMEKNPTTLEGLLIVKAINHLSQRLDEINAKLDRLVGL